MTALPCLDEFSVCGFAEIMTLTTIAYSSAVQAAPIGPSSMGSIYRPRLLQAMANI